ncbi:MAG: hypothetical protein IBX67_06565 [Dehalococcoidia bacterium]|nr:hypothetical protein [Dehalococcoidia bacterium]
MKGRQLLLVLAVALVGVLLWGSVPAMGLQVSEPALSLVEARRIMEQDLLPLAGAGFVGIAYSEAEGEVIVFVEHEQAERMVPDSFGGYTVRTEVTGRIEVLPAGVAEPTAGVSQDRQSRLRPLVGGTSLSAYATDGGLIYLYAGTLGMVTYDGKILSNAHVIAMEPRTENSLEPGTPVIQPGTGDRGRLGSRVGELAAYIPIEFGPDASNYADAAIANIDSGVDVSPGEQFSEGGNYWVEGWTEVSRGDIVRKSGRTTGVTTGEVVHTNASFMVSYGDESARFVDLIVVSQEDWSFAGAGDSGSAVDMGGEFVGLVFAGSETHAVICKAEHIIAGLGVAFEPLEAVSYLTIFSSIGGSVIEPGEGVFSYDTGAVIGLVAEPVGGFRFVGWTGDVGAVDDVEAAETTIAMDDDYSVRADFEPMPGLYGLAVSSTAGGSVTEPGEGVFAYESETVVDLVAEPDEGHRFVEWLGDVATIDDVEAPETTISMTGNYSIKAGFELTEGLYELTLSSTAGGSVAVPGEGVFIRPAGAVVELVAEPDPGYQFVKWAGDVDTIVDVNAARTAVTMRDSYSITARFATLPEPRAVLTVSSTEGGFVITPGEGEFESTLGTEVRLVAEPDNGYRFAGWSGDVDTISDAYASSTSIITDSSYSIIADFERVSSRCCAATAAYDTPMAEELVILREFRDEYLYTNPAGQAFADLYYRVSPAIAEFITTHPALKPIVRTGLLPAVAMSALVLDSSSVQKIAVVGLGVLVIVALAARAIRWGARNQQHV